MKCVFCGAEIAKGTGLIIVKNDGKKYELCSSKCEKNMFKLKRNPRKLLWTVAGRKEKEKRMALLKKKV